MDGPMGFLKFTDHKGQVLYSTHDEFRLNNDKSNREGKQAKAGAKFSFQDPTVHRGELNEPFIHEDFYKKPPQKD